MKYRCLDCDHRFDELGLTYADLDMWCTNAIGACPQCLSDDYEEVDPLLEQAMHRMNSFFLDKVTS
jgi:hypothetical protein